ncbi:Trm112 family protein [Candidatus Woesearchaeota archaeon]|nr:MAG: Trm112 family protein [Candidatus Woesearchaeota archaeon]
MALPKELLEILACPVCKGDLVEKKNKLVCRRCKIDYPIEDGIPILLPPENTNKNNKE